MTFEEFLSARDNHTGESYLEYAFRRGFTMGDIREGYETAREFAQAMDRRLGVSGEQPTQPHIEPALLLLFFAVTVKAVGFEYRPHVLLKGERRALLVCIDGRGGQNERQQGETQSLEQRKPPTGGRGVGKAFGGKCILAAFARLSQNRADCAAVATWQTVRGP